MSVSFPGIQNTSTVWALISVKGELGHTKWLNAEGCTVRKKMESDHSKEKGLDGMSNLAN